MICISVMLCGIFAFCISASPSANDYIVENYNITDEYYMKLGEEINSYSKLDTSEEKSISKNVTVAVNVYRKELNALQEHPDVGNRLLSAEANAAFAKGSAAGRLAWIYSYNILSLHSSEGPARVKNKYEEICQRLDAMTDSDVIVAASNGMCTELNRAAYKEKIEELKLSSDSLASTGLIESALRSIDNIDSPDLFGDNFASLYSKLKSELELQRSRDSLSEQLKSLFTVICADDSYAANETVALFEYKLKNAKSIPEMNEAIRFATSELISANESGSYYLLFISELRAEISEEASRASHSNKCVDLLPLFESYNLKRKKALTKDNIAEIILSSESAELKKLEAEFNASGGRIDLCTDFEALETELIRAKYRKQLIDAVASAKEKLNVFLGEYSKDKFAVRIEETFKSTDDELVKLSAPLHNFEEKCRELFSIAEADLKDTLTESKAERFLLDHKAIILKPSSEITVTDELFLKAAIEVYKTLEADVRAVLSGQISSLVEKYNILTQIKIRALITNDVLYSDLCELLCDELKLIKADSIDVFYNKCNLIIQKAEALAFIVSYYREILSGDIGESYTSTERKELDEACQSFSNLISELNTDSESFSKELSIIKSSTQSIMNRTEQCARVRIAARSSENLTVQSLIAEARADIKSCADRSEMVIIADRAIFKINRELTKDEIAARSEKYEFLIDSMKFLSEIEKAEYRATLKTLKSNSRSNAALSENITVLEFVWSGFCESLEKTMSEASKADLIRGRESYTELLESECEKISSSIEALVYISSKECDDFLNKINAIKAKFKSDIISASSSEEVADIHKISLEQLYSIRSSADGKNLEIYKSNLCNELDKFGSVKENYSVENYNLLRQAISDWSKKINASKSMSECNAVFEAAQLELGEINTLLDDAKDSALSALYALFTKCNSEAKLYSKDNLDKIEKLYAAAVEEISAICDFSSISKISELLNKALSSMNSINKDILFSSADAHAINTSGTKYPTDHSFIFGGYWGSITAQNGLPSNAVFSITSPKSPSELSNIERIIHAAAKKDKISGSISNDTLKLLKKCVVSAELDISLSLLADNASTYSIKMLLPEELSNENIMGIVFIDENKNVEFYNCISQNSLISFELSHFSNYYIVSENTINLIPLIIFLIILLSLELIALATIVALRFYRKRKEDESTMFPLLSAFAPNLISPFVPSALRVKPDNGVGLTLLLAGAVIAIGCALAFFAKLELKDMRAKKEVPHTIKKGCYKELAQKQQIRLPKHQAVAALSAVNVANSTSDDFTPAYDDIDIEEEIYEDNEIIDESTVSDNYKHRAEINIDSIAEQFEAGDLVNLELLKKKRLVNKRTDYVKILARGSLTKPLVIEAQDFSHAAEEMLRAVGGEAIRVK